MSGVVLYAPSSYPPLDESICNGCGAKGGFPVPDTIWGLDVSECCNIHDFMYHIGVTHQDKEQADRVFLNNMMRVLEAAEDNHRLFGLIKHFRRSRIKTYYETVHYYGGSAFWAGKNALKNEYALA